jgi:effector-binding domain-containing protein
MEKKQTVELQALVFSVETTFGEMGAFVGTKMEQMMKDAALQGQQVAGAPMWVYTGADGNPTTRFTLDICLPVAPGTPYSGEFALKTLPAFTHVVTIHNGPWNELGNTYCMLMKHIDDQGLTYTGVCREIYHVMDFQNPQKNITEVQVGV